MTRNLLVDPDALRKQVRGGGGPGELSLHVGFQLVDAGWRRHLAQLADRRAG
jgi:hypothetical protein